MVLEYLQIQNKACASLCFSASSPRIGYRSLCMHQGLSCHDLPRHVESARLATWNRGAIEDRIPHPLWVVIKCLGPRKTKFVKFPPSRPGRKRRQMPGVCPGGMFKLRFDWYINCYQITAFYYLSFEQILSQDFILSNVGSICWNREGFL